MASKVAKMAALGTTPLKTERVSQQVSERPRIQIHGLTTKENGILFLPLWRRMFVVKQNGACTLHCVHLSHHTSC